MGARLCSWWQTIRKSLAVVGIIVACVLVIALVVGIIGGYVFNWNWTGLSRKTLWDWLQLIFIPAVLTLGAIWYIARQNHDLHITLDNQRQESERFRAFSYEELLKRDKLSLDLFWLRDESLEGTDKLPPSAEIAASIVEDLQNALEQFMAIVEDLGGLKGMEGVGGEK